MFKSLCYLTENDYLCIVGRKQTDKKKNGKPPQQQPIPSKHYNLLKLKLCVVD